MFKLLPTLAHWKAIQPALAHYYSSLVKSRDKFVQLSSVDGKRKSHPENISCEENRRKARVRGVIFKRTSSNKTSAPRRNSKLLPLLFPEVTQVTKQKPKLLTSLEWNVEEALPVLVDLRPALSAKYGGCSSPKV